MSATATHISFHFCFLMVPVWMIFTVRATSKGVRF